VKASELTVTEFRTKVFAHLHAALASVPERVPEDVVTDPAAEELMKPLEALTDFLYQLGSEERDKEHTERDRQLKIEAKRRKPEIEQLAMQIDGRVQHAMVVLGSSAVNVIIPMDAELLVSAFVQFLEVFPPAAFAIDRAVPDDFPSRRDITVATIIAAMRIRKENHNGT
jgi:hypothetical protein